MPSLDEYLTSFSEPEQMLLREMRRIIFEAAPQAEERISYRMPAYFECGVLVYFAMGKDYLGFYPTSSPIIAFADELRGFTPTKGSIHLPLNKPLPKALIQRIVQFKLKENERKSHKEVVSAIGVCPD